MRLLIFRSLRSDSLCTGGEGGGSDCPEARDAECITCGCIWEPEDTTVTGACPRCQGWKIRILRCDRCPVDELSYVRAHSFAGRLFERVLELDFNTENFSLPWQEVSAVAAKGLQILKSERDRYQREEQERQRQEWEQKNGRR